MTRKIAAILACTLATTLAACDPADDCTPGQANRIVCLSGDRVIYDDFSKRDTHLAEGGIIYVSRTTGRRSRVTGSCHAYMATIPAGWKPTFPAPPVR